MDIKLYGTKTLGYSFIKKAITDYIDFHHIKYNLFEINRIDQFISDNIASLPSVVIDSDLPIEVNEAGDLSKSLKMIFRKIGTRERVRNILCLFDFNTDTIEIVNHIRNYYNNEYYTVYLVDITDYTNENRRNKIDQFARLFEQSYLGDLSSKLLIEPIVISKSESQQIDFTDYELIIIPYTKMIKPFFTKNVASKIIHSHEAMKDDNTEVMKYRRRIFSLQSSKVN
jgi:hypothetical protein